MVNFEAYPHNRLLVADTQHQNAASRHGLRALQRQRYPSSLARIAGHPLER
jgi:hypothetical protein